MKKLILLLIAVFLIFGTSVLAEDEEYIIKDSNGNDLIKYTYSIIDNTAQITAAHLCEETDSVTFPSTIEGCPVEVNMSRGAFTGNDVENVKRIEFEEGISKIKFIFTGRKSLKEVLLPESLTELDASFSGCGLERIAIPSQIETVPGCFANNCADLREVKLPDGLKEIKEDAFSACTSLENIALPNSLKTIEQSAFSGCTALKEIVIPKGIKGINPYTFANCENLKTAELPEGIEYIGNYAFDGTGIESIILPKTLKEISSNALSHTRLEQITIPSGVESMGEYALSGCTQLKKLKMSASTQVPENVFWSSTNLEDVIIEGEMTKQLFSAFCDKTAYGEKLFDEYDEDFIVFDGNYLAKYKGADKNPVIPDGITEIAERAFQYTDIDSVTFPKTTINEIPSYCFIGSKIKEITIPATVKKVSTMAFYGCESLESVTIEDGVESVADSTFLNCFALDNDKVNIGKSVRVSKNAFKQSALDEDFDDTKPTPSPTPVLELKTLEVNGADMSISVDGKTVDFPDAKPFVDDNDRTQVPVRAIAEMLDCDVDWNGDTKTATVTRDSGVIKLTLGSDIMTVNGKDVKMDTTVIIKDGRTYIPVRFIAEELGLAVEWK